MIPYLRLSALLAEIKVEVEAARQGREVSWEVAAHLCDVVSCLREAQERLDDAYRQEEEEAENADRCSALDWYDEHHYAAV